MIQKQYVKFYAMLVKKFSKNNKLDGVTQMDRYQYYIGM